MKNSGKFKEISSTSFYCISYLYKLIYLNWKALKKSFKKKNESKLSLTRRWDKLTKIILQQFKSFLWLLCLFFHSWWSFCIKFTFSQEHNRLLYWLSDHNDFMKLFVTETLFKKRLWHSCFPVNFAKFLRTPFLMENLRWLLLL